MSINEPRPLARRLSRPTSSRTSRAMPFPDESFYLVVFDPPHIKASRAGKSGRFSKIYGVLPNDWQ
jgi:hypothetical protein